MSDKAEGVAWELSDFFDEFQYPAHRDFDKQLNSDITVLQKRFEQMGRLRRDNLADWETLLLASEDAGCRLEHLTSYLHCLAAAHADREDYDLALAALERLRAEFGKIEIGIVQAFRDLDTDTWDLLTGRPQLKDIAYALERYRQKAEFSMSSAQEALASDLGVDGIQAWGRLYEKISSKMVFSFRDPTGNVVHKPMSQWRALISHHDRKMGRAAFVGGNKAWQANEDVFAAALNAIAGTRLSLYRHRGQEDYLAQALFQAGIKRQTLKAMYTAIKGNIDIGRAILKQKARFFDRNGIWFFEREAALPVGDAGDYTWLQATDLVAGAFATAYPALANYFNGMLKKRWIESQQRPAKRPGAFCTDSPLNRQQRVFMTFSGTLGDASTLAHEVGHAWHSHLMRDMRPWALRYPMTLAETASIFAEHILAQGIYADDRIGENEKVLMLDEELSAAAVFLLDITTRFEFEKAFYRRRQDGEVTVSELKALMTATQQRIYGDALLEDGPDPYFWASKLHFFITHTTFYNFPYTFGFLLARALTGMFHKKGPQFLESYEDFLRSTGSGSVEEVLLQSLGVDITTPAFWEDGIKSLMAPLERYKSWIERFKAAQIHFFDPANYDLPR